MGIENLTDDQKARAKECQNAEELVEYLEGENVKLSIDELEAVSGGGGDIGFLLSLMVPRPCTTQAPAET